MDRLPHLFADIDENGILVFRNLPYVKKILRSLRSKAVEFSVVEVFGRKTLPQLRYYRGIVLPFVHAGITALGNREWTKDDVHEEMLRRFAPRKDLVDGRDGEIISFAPIRTRNMTKAQMSEFIDSVTLWAAEFLGIAIPPPTTEEQKAWQ